MAKLPAAVRARRLLALLHLFDPGQEVALADIARTLGVTPAEAADDLNMLACCGLHPYSPDTLVPLYLEDGVVRVFGELPALDRAVRLSAREARALAAALELAGVAADSPLTNKLLANAAPQGNRSEEIARLVAVASGLPVGDLLGDLVLARSERRCVRITYQTAGRVEARERIVEPLGLVNDQGSWYLEAYCRSAGEVRTFRVDRIREHELLDEVFEPRDVAGTGSAFVTEGLPRARVRFSRNAERALAEWPGATLVSEDAEGSVVEVPFSGHGWIARQVLACLGDAEVIEPAELRATVREMALQLASDEPGA